MNKIKNAHLGEFNLISQKYRQWIKEESSQIKGNIVKVLTLLSQLNIVEFLIKNEINIIKIK